MTNRSFVRAATHPEPVDEWAAIAPLLAAQGLVRLSPDGGKTYPTRKQRRVTTELPSQPAAVRTYDRSGCAPALCLDFDTKRGDVNRDVAAVTKILDRLMIRWFSDISPNGGRHVYVPLADPAPRHEIEPVLRALQRICPTLDPTPMLNVLAGCIRPPGSKHKTGGHQRLDQSITSALAAFHNPVTRATWWALRRELDATHPIERTDTVETEQLPALKGWRKPDADYERIALTGEIPAKYPTTSEARQAVLWACVASGWSFADVAVRINDGTWPGLASLYTKYSTNSRHTQMAKDWNSAIAFEMRRRHNGKKTSVHECTTSPQETHRGEVGPGVSVRPNGAVNEAVRVWLAAVDFLTPHLGPGARAVLYALAEAAVKSDRLEVEFGNRSLAIASGFDQATVGRILVQLREAPVDRLLIDLVRPANQTRAATYALVIPPLLVSMCERKPWRRGRINAIRPVFRELGMVAAFVHMAVENSREPLTSAEVAQRANVSRSATYEALSTLHAFGLVEKTSVGSWASGAANLERLAEQLGCQEQVREQTERYKAERRAWHEYLGLVEKLVPRDFDPNHVNDYDADILEFTPRASVHDRNDPDPARAGPGAWFDDVEGLIESISDILGPVTILGDP